MEEKESDVLEMKMRFEDKQWEVAEREMVLKVDERCYAVLKKRQDDIAKRQQAVAEREYALTDKQFRRIDLEQRNLNEEYRRLVEKRHFLEEKAYRLWFSSFEQNKK